MDQNKERKMKKVEQFGETVEGYNIPVLKRTGNKSVGRDTIYIYVLFLDAGHI
jgi:hypothetical protein